MTESISPFNWLGTFANGEVETAYRAHRLDSDRMLLRVVSAIVIFSVCGFIVNDVRNPNTDSPGWPALFASRILVVSIVIAYAALLSHIKNARMLDAMTMLIVVAVALSSIWVDSSRPKDFFTHVGADIVILEGIYLVLPLSQRLRIASALAYSMGLLLLYFVYKDFPSPLTSTSVLVSVIIANVLGVLVSFRLARIQRAEYAALISEQAARQALEHAQTKIRSLSGLIPICAGCKKVRNDKGFWEQVENYVRARSEAEFSHSLCPTCVEQYRV